MTLAVAAVIGAAVLAAPFAIRTERGEAASQAVHVPPQPAEPVPTATSGITADAEQLALLSTRSYDGAIGDFRFVAGQVRNVSSHSLDHIEAVATWFDADGRELAIESSPLDVTPLQPGQVSGFKTMTRVHPGLDHFTITFRTSRGVQIPADDRREPDASTPASPIPTE